MPTCRHRLLAAFPTVRPFALMLVLGSILGGCASVAPTPVPTGPPTAEQRTAAAEALAVERQWLQSWFKGTPVLVAQRQDGALSIDVPREFCFEPGRSSIKPPLAAVLDKVAESLRRLPLAQLPLLAAPNDVAGPSPLALQRAAQVREHLRSRGVAEARLGKPSATTAAAVQLRMEDDAP